MLVACVLLWRETSAAQPPSADPQPARIAWSDIGARATEQSTGDALSVSATNEGALLRCGFQKMEAHATREGLWLTSTADGSQGDRFRVVADAIGRGSDPARHSLRRHVTDNNSPDIALARAGAVEAQPPLVRFIRPGIAEEYSLSVDGVRQDFLITQRPAGVGSLRVSLALTSASAEAATYGAKLILDRSKRALAYSRLRVVDATGKELSARMEVTSPNRITVIVEDATATYPLRIDPTFSDENWVSLGGIRGANAAVRAVAVNSVAGLVYIGGDFNAVGTVRALCVAVWNGTEWSALGTGVNSTVNALAVSGSDLYAGGVFNLAGVVSASGIAKWNGSTWSAVGSGADGIVHALYAAGTDIYVGGAFSSAGGVADTANIAKWNGSAWSALGTGMDNAVRAISHIGSVIIAGGEFANAGGEPASRIARWSGTAWSALGAGANDVVFALTPGFDKDIYVGGSFTSAGGVANTNRIANYHAVSGAWSALSTGMNSTVRALATTGGDLLYAGGDFTTAGGGAASYMAKWNGSTWSPPGTGMGGDFTTVNALAVIGSDVCAGGRFTTAGAVKANCIARWNGTAWSALGGGFDGIVRTLAVSGTDLYAGGEFTSAGEVTANRIAKWNGSAWSALGDGMNGTVRALAVSGSDLYAGGEFTTAGVVSANRIAKWNGSAWSALGDGMNGIVRALAVSGSDLYAGGDFTTAGVVSANRVAKWNGSAWSGLGSGPPVDGLIYAVAWLDGELFAGGGGFGATRCVAKWDGTFWEELGDEWVDADGDSPTVYALAVMGGHLYAGGQFTGLGIQTVYHLVQRFETGWGRVQRSGDRAVFALAGSGNDLYVAGKDGIEKFTGGARSGTLGPGNIFALAADSAYHLFAGGDFNLAGNIVSGYAAQLNLDGPDLALEQPLGTNLIDNGQGVSYGAVEFGTSSPPKVFTIRNSGNVVLSIGAVQVAGLNSSDFTVNTTGMSSSVPPGGSTTFSITFTPGALGFRICTLFVFSNDDDESPFDIIMQATGVTPPEIAVEQPSGTDLADGSASIGYGLVSTGTPSGAKIFTIHNFIGSGADLAISSVTVTGGNSGDFVVNTAGMSVMVIPGESTTFSVTFNPTAPGPRTTTLQIVTSDGNESPFDITLTGTGLSPGPGTLAFGSVVNYVNEEGGTQNVPIIRTGGNTGAVSVLVNSTPGTAAADDFTPVVNAPVNFAEGQTTTLVSVNPTLDAIGESNEDFTLALSAPTGGATIGSIATATVRIVEPNDATKPTVTIATPLANQIIAESAGTTVNVTGSTKDNRGLKTVEVQLNGGPFVEAPLVLNATNTSATYALPVTAIDGTNTLVVKSTDTRNNSLLVTRTFTRVVMRPLVVNIDSPTIPVTNAGTVTAGFMPPPTPVLRQVGKSYTITATPKTKPAPGFVFDGWTVSGGPTLAQVGVTPIALEKPALTFAFRENLVLTARFLANPFSFVSGTYNGLVRSDPTQPGEGTVPGVDTEGFINVVLQSTGAFSAKLRIDGLELIFPGAFDNTTPLARARFGTSRDQTVNILRPGKPSLIVRLFLDLATPGVDDKVTGTVTQNLRNAITAVSNVDADRAYYGSVKRPAVTTAGSATITMASTGGRSVDEAVSGSAVPAGTRILSITDATHLVLTKNALATSAGISLSFTRNPEDAYLTISGLKKSSGVFTAIFSSKGPASQPEGFTPAYYPQGDGFASITVSPAGVLSLAGTLADNTALSASAPLARHSVAPFITCPIFAPLYKGKRGGIIGQVTLDSSQPLSDMSAMDGDAPPNAPFLWFRPFQDVQHYPYGWAEGVKVDFLGAKFLAAAGFSVLTGLDSTHNADLIFSDGGLSGAVGKVVSISNADIVTKVPTTDESYTLAISRTTGKITGTLTHNVTNTKPSFQGMIFQKGAGRGAYGFFLTTIPAVKDSTGQSGGVSLVPQP